MLKVLKHNKHPEGVFRSQTSPRFGYYAIKWDQTISTWVRINRSLKGKVKERGGVGWGREQGRRSPQKKVLNVKIRKIIRSCIILLLLSMMTKRKLTFCTILSPFFLFSTFSTSHVFTEINCFFLFSFWILLKK